MSMSPANSSLTSTNSSPVPRKGAAPREQGKGVHSGENLGSYPYHSVNIDKLAEMLFCKRGAAELAKMAAVWFTEQSLVARINKLGI